MESALNDGVLLSWLIARDCHLTVTFVSELESLVSIMLLNLRVELTNYRLLILDCGLKLRDEALLVLALLLQLSDVVESVVACLRRNYQVGGARILFVDLHQLRLVLLKSDGHTSATQVFLNSDIQLCHWLSLVVNRLGRSYH